MVTAVGTEKETDRQTDRDTERETDIDRQRDKQTETGRYLSTSNFALLLIVFK